MPACQSPISNIKSILLIQLPLLNDQHLARRNKGLIGQKGGCDKNIKRESLQKKSPELKLKFISKWKAINFGEALDQVVISSFAPR